MITFLMEEGALTVGALSGIFTTALLNSLKRNIIDPSIERIIPSHKLDKQESFGDLFPLPMGTPDQPKGSTEPPKGFSTEIRWQTFVRDFITWIIIMFFLYIFWKKILQPLKPASQR